MGNFKACDQQGGGVVVGGLCKFNWGERKFPKIIKKQHGSKVTYLKIVLVKYAFTILVKIFERK